MKSLCMFDGSRSFMRLALRAALPLVGIAPLLVSGFPSTARAQNAIPPVATPAPISNLPPAKPGPSIDDDPEVKLGRQYSQENDKQVKLITDKAILERVNRIGGEIGEAADKLMIPATYGNSKLKPFHYTFKVVDDKDVNAYSMPGGFIYVNKGLIDFIRSDDELAGVLAHEVTHAAHHHVLKLIHEQGKIQNLLTPIQLAAIAMMISGKENSFQAGYALTQASQLYSVAKVNGYSVNAEKDADHGGLLLMTHTKYNPAGLYSFMVRLASFERTHGFAGEMGILRTHPPTPERVTASKEMLDELHLPIYLSVVDPTWRTVVTVKTQGDTEIAELAVRGLVLCRVIGANGIAAKERGEKLGRKLDGLLDRQLQPFEVRISRDQSSVTARGITVLTAADAAAQGKSLSSLTHEMGDAIAEINQKQQVEQTF